MRSQNYRKSERPIICIPAESLAVEHAAHPTMQARLSEPDAGRKSRRFARSERARISAGRSCCDAPLPRAVELVAARVPHSRLAARPRCPAREDASLVSSAANRPKWNSKARNFCYFVSATGEIHRIATWPRAKVEKFQKKNPCYANFCTFVC